MKKITIIGAGTMGNGIAHCFAQHKFEVCLIDVSEANLQNAEIKISNNRDINFPHFSPGSLSNLLQFV